MANVCGNCSTVNNVSNLQNVTNYLTTFAGRIFVIYNQLFQGTICNNKSKCLNNKS
jgi:hypothetical protein